MKMRNNYCWNWIRILLLSTTILLLSQIHSTTSSSLQQVYDGDDWSPWSGWSPCSRTCDGGVTQQFRRCKSPNGCHGVPIKRKMCNMQPCGESQDYRGDQCRAFNGMKFDGKRRSWEPLEDPENPCALVCRTLSTGHVVKLSPKLRDGTRCKTGALHVCVDGRCEPVGCDLKIGSPKKIDACGVCGGDSKSCTSPVYRWDLESSGPCTARCGGGIQPVKSVCRNSITIENVDAFFCNSVTRPMLDTQNCHIHPCEPQWEFGEWSVCSTTCGGGLKIRKVYCAQEKNGTKIQVADKLCHHIRRPTNQEPCNPQPCPHWHAGPWSSCSVTCGDGYLTRNVVCRDSSNLPNFNCDKRLKPGENKGCKASTECPIIPPTSAPTSQVLNRSPTKKRRINKTTPTDGTTTEGIPVDYQAPDIDNDIYVEEELPREHTLPLIQPYPPMDNAVLFDSNALPSEPTFVAGVWGPCSATCGEGRRTREVNCKIFLEFSRTIANLPDKECPGPKPVESDVCFNSPCHLGDRPAEKLSDVHQAALADSDTGVATVRKTMTVGLPPGISFQDMSYSWKVLGYTPCSSSCLGGIQEAMIQCVRDYDQRIATPVLCMDKPQPDIATTRTCNDHSCMPRWNVTEFGPCSKPCGGGVMTREVSCIHEVTRGNTVLVPMSICPSSMPRTEKLCNTVQCPPYWEPGEWGKCNKPCGGGSRTRIIHCKQISALGQVMELTNGDAHCSSPKPAQNKTCNKKSCSKKTNQRSGVSADYETEFKEKMTLNVKGKGTVYAGVALKLRCPSGKGMNKGSLIWMKGHEYLKVQPERMELIHRAGALKIKNTTYSDSGIYTCVYNGRPVSNITLMVKPYPDANQRDKRPRGRQNVHDSTLYADQEEGGVSVPMYHGQIITPNSKFYESPATSSASASPRSFFFQYFLSLFLWIRWPQPQLLTSLTRDLTEIQFEDLDDDVGMLRALVHQRLFVEEEDLLENVVSPQGNVPNSKSHLRPHAPIKKNNKEEDEDELSKVEKLLSKKIMPSEIIRKDEVQWVEGEWTHCLDLECFNWNSALKRRQVSCEYPNGTSTVPEAMHCNLEEKPVEAIECYNPKCLGRWHTHAWSFCKVPPACNLLGFKTRVLKCLWYGSGRPAGHACHSLPRPIVTKSCSGPPCNNSKKAKVKKIRDGGKRYKHQRNSKGMTTPRKTTTESNELIDYWDLYDQDNNN